MCPRGDLNAGTGEIFPDRGSNAARLVNILGSTILVDS
jgi:hypothetical protein